MSTPCMGVRTGGIVSAILPRGGSHAFDSPQRYPPRHSPLCRSLGMAVISGMTLHQASILGALATRAQASPDDTAEVPRLRNHLAEATGNVQEYTLNMELWRSRATGLSDDLRHMSRELEVSRALANAPMQVSMSGPRH